jgi:hypothetical protein
MNYAMMHGFTNAVSILLFSLYFVVLVITFPTLMQDFLYFAIGELIENYF